MWTYKQKSGVLMHDALHIGAGYSGHGAAKNDPSAQGTPMVGPIPCGLWLVGRAFDSDYSGPLTLPLLPVHGTETFGRAGFLMHGDSNEHPGEASHGCIVMARAIREVVNASKDKYLRVVEE